jgi:hypothetical protein
MIASDPLDRTLVNITGLLLEKTPKIVTVNVYRYSWLLRDVMTFLLSQNI